MLHVVSFSTGLSSALCAVRVLEKYGKENTKIVFLDTKIEDDDNYRFMADFEKKFDVEILKLSEGRTPYQVFEDKNIIPVGKVVPCTFNLKINLFKNWLKTQEKPITIYIGYDWKEIHRCEKTKSNYEALGYNVDFPLLWDPIEKRRYSEVFINDYGIRPPRMYSMGYTHANCGGMCVKQGMGDWLRTLKYFPERFEKIENWEAYMREKLNINYSFIKDRRFNSIKFLTLRDLRDRYEKRDFKESFLTKLDSESACVVCSVGDLGEEE